jgi:predicted O-methyltransferase YrrM
VQAIPPVVVSVATASGVGEVDAALYAAWVDASDLAARAALWAKPGYRNKDERAVEDGAPSSGLAGASDDEVAARLASLAHEAALCVLEAWQSEALKPPHQWRDPTTHSRSRFLQGVDVVPDAIWWLPRAVSRPSNASQRQEEWRSRVYRIRILHPDTLPHATTTAIGEAWLPRRLPDAVPSRVRVVVVGAQEEGAAVAPEVLVGGDAPTHTECTWTGQADGRSVNRALWDAVRADSDVVVVVSAKRAQSAAPIVLDPFVPAYACLPEPEVCVMTPLHVLECNGVDDRAGSWAESRESLLRRSGASSGAVVLAEGVPTPPPSAASTVRGIGQGGMNVLAEDPWVRMDGRAIDVTSSHLGRHGAPCYHNWLSYETDAVLTAALRTLRPRIVLELGAWYGASTRRIRRECPDALILTADWFKDAAVSDFDRAGDRGPIDRFYFQHQRLHSFARTMHDEEEALGIAGRGRVVVFRGDIYDAVEQVARIPCQPDLVFIDCEKKTRQLRQLLDRLADLFPRATIVGDDLIADSVQRAVSGLPRTHVWRHAYVRLPQWAQPPSLTTALLDAIRQSIRERSPTEVERAVERCINACDLMALPALLQPPSAAGEAPPDLFRRVPELSAGTIAHSVARTRHVDYLLRRGVWERFVLPAFRSAAPGALLNDLALTPFDYLTHRIKLD